MTPFLEPRVWDAVATRHVEGVCLRVCMYMRAHMFQCKKMVWIGPWQNISFLLVTMLLFTCHHHYPLAELARWFSLRCGTGSGLDMSLSPSGYQLMSVDRNMRDLKTYTTRCFRSLQSALATRPSASRTIFENFWVISSETCFWS